MVSVVQPALAEQKTAPNLSAGHSRWDIVKTVPSVALQVSISPFMSGIAAQIVALSYFSGMSIPETMAAQCGAFSLGVAATFANYKIQSLWAKTQTLHADAKPDSHDAVSEVKSVTSANFEEMVLKSEIPVIVDAYASWCPPCKAVAPIVENLSSELKGKILFAKFDVDEDTSLKEKLEIAAMPTFLFYKNGECVGKHAGAMPKEAFQSEILKYFF